MFQKVKLIDYKDFRINARILTKSSRRVHITPVLKTFHWLKIQDRIIYKMLMLTIWMIWMLTVNVYIIVIYDVITVDYCKCILLYCLLTLAMYIGYWTLNKYYYYYY